jgi:predicted NUDIX family NTP pyrophosphohydrolase
MAKHSAGILLYRKTAAGYEVLLVHPGGPFWARKDLGSWSVPKGEFEPDEEPLKAAKREFLEEVGAPAPAGDYGSLGEAKTSSGKLVQAFSLEADFNLENFKSNMFEMEWPPKSGQKIEVPENDKAAWLPLPAAKQKLIKYQAVFIDRLADHLGQDLSGTDPPRQAALF